MPTITINGRTCSFSPGQTILQVANANGVAIPQYCYHEALSIVASCRICLGEVWAPNPRTGALEPFMGGKLVPTCQTPAADGMVVSTESPRAVQNQKAVMEYLLINHPLDCPVCDQAGECLLQDFSYRYGRGESRFEEVKVKQPKKDVGPHVLLYADRCIMCSRCVRFTREITGTNELIVTGRGDRVEIDVFPGRALDNELSANVVDLCPVGALLDKDFLFAQRVWFLKSTPSLDPLTASGDNIWIEHNEGRIYRIKPRTNPAVNRWWITDEVRYGWKFVHSDRRLRTPTIRQHGVAIEADFNRAYLRAVQGLESARRQGRIALVVSPMLPCEEAFVLVQMALALDSGVAVVLGPVPRRGQDKVFPPGAGPDTGYVVYAEKAPNARGVRRVLEAVVAAHRAARDDAVPRMLTCEEFQAHLSEGNFAGVILTGNYPDSWAPEELLAALDRTRPDRPFVVVIDTLASAMTDAADVVLPGATWAEKAGTFENARGMLQGFEAAIPVIELAKPEGQIALDLMAVLRSERERGEPPPPVEFPETIVTPVVGPDTPETFSVAPPVGPLFNPAQTRVTMSAVPGLEMFATGVLLPTPPPAAVPAMEMVEL